MKFREEELDDMARQYVRQWQDERGNGPNVIALSGELGTGKTTFVRAVASALGLSDAPIKSPTFNILSEYRLPSGGPWSYLIHVDAYRLSNVSDLLPLRFDHYLKAGNIVFVEWPEKIISALPAGTIFLRFEHQDDKHRHIRTNGK